MDGSAAPAAAATAICPSSPAGPTVTMIAKHGKERIELPGLDPSSTTVGDVKDMLRARTGVLPKRQKLIGLRTRKGAVLHDAIKISELKAEGGGRGGDVVHHRFMLMGTPEGGIFVDPSERDDLPDVVDDLDLDFDAGSGSADTKAEEASEGGKVATFLVPVPGYVRPGEEFQFQVFAGGRIVRVRCPLDSRPGKNLRITLPLDQIDGDAAGGGGNGPKFPGIPTPDSDNVTKIPNQWLAAGERPAYMVKIPEGMRGGQNFPVTVGGQRLTVSCPNMACSGMSVRIVPPPPPPGKDGVTPRASNGASSAAPNKPLDKTRMFEVAVPDEGLKPGQPFALPAAGNGITGSILENAPRRIVVPSPEDAAETAVGLKEGGEKGKEATASRKGRRGDEHGSAKVPPAEGGAASTSLAAAPLPPPQRQPPASETAVAAPIPLEITVPAKPDALTTEEDAAEVQYHWVEKGDSLRGICLRYKVKANDLRRANNFAGSDLQRAPRRLVIPKARVAVTYPETARRGEAIRFHPPLSAFPSTPTTTATPKYGRFNARFYHEQNVREVFASQASNLSDVLSKVNSDDFATFLEQIGMPNAVVEMNPHMERLAFAFVEEGIKCCDRDEDLRVRVVFHGTHESNVDSILRTGLDRSKRRRQVHGTGEYFSCCPVLSKQNYCRGGQRMIVFAVIASAHDVRTRQIVVVEKAQRQLPIATLHFANDKALIGQCMTFSTNRRSERTEVGVPSWRKTPRPISSNRET